MKTKDLLLISLMTAIISIISPIVLIMPFSVVPMSLSTFIISITIIILGRFKGTLSVIIYILLGLIGLPVFSGFSGGLAKVIGPTGGYIIGYIFMAFVSGVFIDKCDTVFMQLLGMLLGLLLLYAFGTFWLKFQMDISFIDALMIGVVPFIFFDIIKIVLASMLGKRIKKLLLSI